MADRGLRFLGIGVIPEAFAACVSARRWDGIFEIPAIIGVVILTRLAASFFLTRSSQVQERI